jgi:aspartate--ammonia ligase
MNASRPDDDIDAIHSIYVDQWDWELVMPEQSRSLQYLKYVVEKIYGAIKRTEFLVGEMFPVCRPSLPENIEFIHSEEAFEQYPDLTPVERETALAKKYGAIFLIGIGHPLPDGVLHGGRAPDYDDWSTPTGNNRFGLNGDIIVWDSVRQDSLTRRLWSGNWKCVTTLNENSFIGTSACSMASFPRQSAEVSDNRVFACCF